MTPVRTRGLFITFEGGEGCGPVEYCFWDTQTSGQTTSWGGTGKTTAEMQTAKTFLDAGWDFVGETKNGTADIWFMPKSDYPKLAWQAADAMATFPMPVYRFRSPATSRYFYTMNEAEKEKLINKYSNVWTYEGVARMRIRDGIGRQVVEANGAKGMPRGCVPMQRQNAATVVSDIMSPL